MFHFKNVFLHYTVFFKIICIFFYFQAQINNGPPSFAEELAKRLGSVLPPQRNVIQESDERSVDRSKGIFHYINDICFT